jgi:hypothetical protein
VRSALLVLASGLALASCTLEGDAPSAEERAPASEYRSASVDEGLDRALRAAQTRGFSPDEDVFRGFVLEGSVEVHEVTLQAGSCYAVLAAGSTGLRELDVALYLADGTEGTRDGASGRTAALLYCPVHAGTYYVTVRASAGSGLFGVRVAHGPTGLDVTAAELLPEAPAAR